MLQCVQVVIFAIIPKLNASRVLGATKSLNFIVVFQYVLRLLRICSLLKKVTSNSGILAGTAWVNLFLYMLASHVSPVTISHVFLQKCCFTNVIIRKFEQILTIQCGLLAL